MKLFPVALAREREHALLQFLDAHIGVARGLHARHRSAGASTRASGKCAFYGTTHYALSLDAGSVHASRMSATERVRIHRYCPRCGAEAMSVKTRQLVVCGACDLH